MAGGGGGGTRVTRTELDPTIQPYVQFGLSELQRLYQGQAPQFYPGQGYIGPSAYTSQAIETAAQRAQAGSPLVSSAQQAVQGATGFQAPTSGMYQDIYGQQPRTGMFEQVYEQAGYSPAAAKTAATAGGQYLGLSPFFQGAFEAAAKPAEQRFLQSIGQIQSAASKAGRYGSGAQGQLEQLARGEFAGALSDVAGKLGYQGYAQERQLQEQALARQAQMGQQALQTQLQAAGGISAAEQAARQAQLAAAGGLTQAEQAAAGTRLTAAQLAPTLAAEDFASAQRLLQAGQAQEAYQQRALEADMQRYQFEQMLPYQRLQSFLSGVYGAPTGMQSIMPTYRSPVSGALGGALVGGTLGQQYGYGGAGLLGGAAIGAMGV